MPPLSRFLRHQWLQVAPSTASIDDPRDRSDFIFTHLSSFFIVRGPHRPPLPFELIEWLNTPALDVSETDASYIVVLDVPGVTREQLKVTIEGRRLHVETPAAETAAPAAEADAKQVAQPVQRVLYRERGVPRYERTIVLPAEVDQAASQAKVENGVLTLTLAKKVPTGARQISVS